MNNEPHSHIEKNNLCFLCFYVVNNNSNRKKQLVIT